MDVFGGAPRFLSYPRTFTVPNGADAILKCQIAGDPRPTVIWERDKTQIYPTGRFRFLEDGNIYNLIVAQARVEDSGQYICKAKNRVGETYAAATLKVEEGDVDPKDKPAFLVKPTSARVARGDNVVFTGQLAGCPVPTVTWEKDGQKLGEIFESGHFSEGCDGDGWHHLKIFNTRVPDAGVYLCKARNTFGEAMTAAVLLVEPGTHTHGTGPPADLAASHPSTNGIEDSQGPDGRCRIHEATRERRQRSRHRNLRDPQTASRRSHQNRISQDTPRVCKVKVFSVSEGKHAKFRCYVTGKPKPEIIWRKDGRLIAPGRRHLLYEDREGYFILKVLYCKQQDNGLYACAASNAAGQTLSSVLLNVKEPYIKFKSQLQDIEVNEREQAVLECEVPGDSTPAVWYLEDRKLHSSAKYIIEQQGSLRRLIIRDITMDDDGIYLCEMNDGGRSIAEVAVKGKIVKRLPRKLDVVEGENAAFCADLDEENVDVSWYKDGELLRESHKTIIKSFGKTHILVFVNATTEDSGIVTFVISDSKSSSQLRVKPRRQAPPSAPVNARMNSDKPNVASLLWGAPPDGRRSGVTAYVIERQEEGSEEWVRCLTAETSAAAVEILGDSIPAEARYRFRVCSVNNHGRSELVEFPGTVHLVPSARIHTHLNDMVVHQGADAEFTIELSTSVLATWHMKGQQLHDDERFKIQQSRSRHSLLIRGAKMEENGSEVTFVAHGVRDSAILFVKAAPVRITMSPGMERVQQVAASESIVLCCELSRSDVQVRWCKDGEVLAPSERLTIQPLGHIRKLIVQSARPSDSGQYACDAADDVVVFSVNVFESPVRIVNSADDTKMEYLLSECIVLTCELSRSNAEVTWYKDGLEIEGSDNVKMESHGVHRSLIVQKAGTEDSGEYVCDAGDDSIFYDITVKEPPVKIVNRSAATMSVLTGGEIVLSCELSRPEAELRWYKDGLEVERSTRSMMEVDGACRRLTIRSATMEDRGTYVCDTVEDTAMFEVTVSEPPVKIKRLADGPAEHKYLTSEDIALECELSRSDTAAKWYKDGEKLEGNERVSIGKEGTLRTLRILDARTTDSGEYLCDVQDDSVVFRVCVEEPPVKIKRLADGPAEHKYLTSEDIALECELSRSDTAAKWYKDGEKLEGNKRVSIGKEGTLRTLRILDARTTDSGEYLCDVQDDSVVFRVCVEEPPVKIKRLADGPAEHKYLTSEDIALECELSRSDTAAKWYKDGEKLEGNERVSIGKEGTLRSLRILDARTTDSGEYLCDVQDDSVVFRVCVEDSPVTIVGSSQISEDRIFTECETIAMTCQLSRSDVQVRWYRDGTELLPNDKIRIESRGLTRELMIFDSEPGDSGQYVCDAGDDKLTFKVTVTEALVLFTNKEKLPEEVHANENGKAVLAAIVSKENTSVAWYRHKEELPEGGKYERKGESRVHSLIIENVQREDCGFYTCRSADDEMVFNVNMAELPLQFVLKLEDLSVQKGGAVTLWCELNKVKGDVMWLKDGKEVQPSGQRVVRAEGRLRSLTLTKATLEDQGEYSCECKDDKTAAQVSVRVPRVVEFISDLHSVTVLEGDDAKFKCMVSPEDVRMTWRANGAEIPPGSDKYVPSRNGLCHTLLIRSCQLTEAGRVTAEAEGVVSGANLQVQETQIVFTRKMASVVAEELQDTTFEVEVSSESAEVQWMKQGVVIQPSPKFLLQQDGRTRRLIVCSTTFADRGNYRCETLHDRTQAKLTVEARRITVKKRLEDLEVYEKEAVTFQVELSHPDVEGVWIKDGIRVKPNNNRRISSAGKVHSLTLSALTLEDSGTITFQANGARSSSRVTVREPPVTFVKQLKDLRVPETTVITLECELSRPNAEVTWYKDDLEMKPSKNVRIYSMGRKRFAHLGKCGVQDSGKYTCDSGESNTSGMLEIYEREIQIVKELEDAEVRENDNAVFVCEVSHEGVNSEWLKDGYKIRSNNSVKIRQEGAKHFLLICKVRAEDAGEIRFTAKNVESVARLDVNELPIKIVKPLRDKTALEKHKVILECKVSKPRARVRWYRGEEEIHPTDKYEICSEDCYRQLVIHDVSFEDEDSYTCDAFDDCSSAKVLVEEQAILVVKDLADVEVTAPHGVVLECEMSVPVIRPPQWSLNGQLLHHGNGVHVENKGTIQKLILSKTSPGMSGVVKFTAGKARSSAQLTVKAD
ncbi:obscurin-like protein 1a isoform X3 [Scyliorhinus canicula]|uniref:obscurin-like protein 1a isoform X3 n=1 Tax=Scyliorhinus canicula TaxID=7830 RepID=UPI0018F6920A|nr:obscurin-like protein 1a isoform X3 [Scyliorhinus canicula]